MELPCTSHKLLIYLHQWSSLAHKLLICCWIVKNHRTLATAGIFVDYVTWRRRHFSQGGFPENAAVHLSEVRVDPKVNSVYHLRSKLPHFLKIFLRWHLFQTSRINLKGCLILLPLLGVTWLLAFLQANSDSPEMSYFFVLLSSSQVITGYPRFGPLWLISFAWPMQTVWRYPNGQPFL